MRYRARLFWHFGWLVLFACIGSGILVSAFKDTPTPGIVPVAVLLLALVGMGTGARKMARLMARPIEMLAEASRRFGAGDLSTRVHIPRHPRGPRRALDELAALGRDWNEMAERIQRLVGAQRELLANVSHELRSPLARIRVALELLPRTPECAARLDEVAADIEELDRLIDDVLTASRLDAAPALREEEVDLGELLEGVRTRAVHDPLCAGLEIRVEGAGGVLRADPALLRRALCNLVENAAKHGAPPIVLRAERDGDEGFLLSVSDEGPGIPPGDLARAAEPFSRLDGARTPSARAGVGLGLTIARRVAENHGGALVLEAGPGGGGLRATLRLPFTRPSPSPQTSSTDRLHDCPEETSWS